LLGLLSEHADGGDMFLRNARPSPNYTALQDRTLHNHRLESLKSSKLIALVSVLQADLRLTVHELFVYIQNVHLRTVRVVVLFMFPLSSSSPVNRNLKKTVFTPNRNALKVYSKRQRTAAPFYMEVSGKPHT
jgi:hypothetical protein